MDRARFLPVRRPFSRRLLRAALMANVLGAVLGTRYVQFTLSSRLEEDFAAFPVLMGFFSLAAFLSVWLLCLRRLRVLREVELEKASVSSEQLGRALLEVHQLADFTFCATLGVWLLAYASNNQSLAEAHRS